MRRDPVAIETDTVALNEVHTAIINGVYNNAKEEMKNAVLAKGDKEKEKEERSEMLDFSEEFARWERKLNHKLKFYEKVIEKLSDSIYNMTAANQSLEQINHILINKLICSNGYTLFSYNIHS